LVSLPSLCRIFAHSNQTFSLSSLEQFLIGCMKHHGTGAQCILNKIKYQKPSDLSELNKFLRIMSIEDTNDIYDNTNHALSSFQRELESIRMENRKLSENVQQIVSEMNNRLNELNNVIKEQKSEIITAKATIGEQNNKIRENETTIAEKNRLIQANEAAINEKNMQIQAKDDQLAQIKKANERPEFPFKSDLFSGIFDGLSKKLGRNLADSSDVDVTASSINTSSNAPTNVLKNDSSYWHSENLPNSWIQFDFKLRKVSITSYSMNEYYVKLKSWKVEGSTDGSTFEIIDNKVDTTDFQNDSGGFNVPNAQKNFPVQPKNKYYRYIRITSTAKTWNNYDYFCLYCVEFFGFVQSD